MYCKYCRRGSLIIPIRINIIYLTFTQCLSTTFNVSMCQYVNMLIVICKVYIPHLHNFREILSLRLQ